MTKRGARILVNDNDSTFGCRHQEAEETAKSDVSPICRPEPRRRAARADSGTLEIQQWKRREIIKNIGFGRRGSWERGQVGPLSIGGRGGAGGGASKSLGGPI